MKEERLDPKHDSQSRYTLANGISRRNFLAGTAAIGALGAFAGLTACVSPDTDTPNTEQPQDNNTETPVTSTGTSERPWEVAPAPITDDMIAESIDCDIVICGAGIAGLPGAALAAEQGANVHIIEKGGTWGMHRLCTAGFNADCQIAAGVITDRKQFVTDAWSITNGSQGRMSSYGLWFDNSAPYINWLEAVCKGKGYQLLAQPATGYKVTNDGVGVEGLWGTYPSMIFFADSEGKFFGTGVDVDWTGILAEYATEKGATFHYNTPAVQLVRDGSGRVTSVIAENESGEYIKLNATKGILLATGDMGADMAMTEYYNPSLRKVGRSVVETKDTGDGQKMGMWIGADMDDFAAGDLFPFVCALKDGTRPDTTEIRSYAAVASLPMLMVDSSGRRIAAEDLPFQAFSIPKLTATPDGHAWTIWDSAWESKLVPGSYLVADYLSINTQEQLEKDITAGVTQKFDTLDALIEGIGFDASIFTEAVERYNKFCAEGVDLDFYKAAGWLTSIDTPPYYASMHVVSLTSTRGGLRNDEHMRVLDKMGLPIPGLYAAGNTAGSFYGNVYPPNIMGSGIGHGQCFSWIAIKDMLGLDYIR